MGWYTCSKMLFFKKIFLSLVCLLSDEGRTQDCCCCPEKIIFLFLLHLLLTECVPIPIGIILTLAHSDSCVRPVLNPNTVEVTNTSLMKSHKVALDQAPLLDEVNVGDLFTHMNGLSLSTYLSSSICANLCVQEATML